jgi:hypothetical protein
MTIEPPGLNEFFVRGYPIAEAVAIRQRWDQLTPKERGEYIFPLPLPRPRGKGD